MAGAFFCFRTAACWRRAAGEDFDELVAAGKRDPVVIE
jgi:hypothetical protein